MASLAPADRVVICTVVRGEIRYGIEQLPQSKRRQDLEGQAGPLFAVIPCESVPEAAGDHYAKIKLTRPDAGEERPVDGGRKERAAYEIMLADAKADLMKDGQGGVDIYV